MRTLRVLAALLALFLTAHLAAQAPTFDAASVKRRTEPGGGGWGRQPGGRFTADGAFLQDLIEFAWGVQPYQIVDGPPWIRTERWDISATGAPNSPAEVLVALQRLLADRFALVVRRETRELPVYALVLARPDGRLGPQLTRAAVDCAALRAEAAKTGVIPPEAKQQCGGAQGRVGSIQMRGAPLSEMTPLLASRLQRTVIDRTGLTGSWSLTLTYTPEPSQIAAGALSPGAQPAIDPNGPSIFTAMQEQLGLRLESARAPVDVLVVERAEFPREN